MPPRYRIPLIIAIIVLVVVVAAILRLRHFALLGEAPPEVKRVMGPVAGAVTSDMLNRLPVARRGIDCSEDVRGADLTVLAKNVRYVGRYYSSTNPRKCLTRSEAVAITRAGMRIWVVFQNGARTRKSFSAALGARDGEFAWNAAQKVGQPGGSAIFFAVDYDPPADDISGFILPYFDNLELGMERARASWSKTHQGNAPRYAIGIYGTPKSLIAITQDPVRRFTLPPVKWLALPPLFKSPTEAAAYYTYHKQRQWTMWQIGEMAISHRVGQPKIGFPCDGNEIGPLPNGSFTVPPSQSRRGATR
ncbi:MAG TPA: DUF1906 domain-containing protein [Capsulimonadaceae bacterium]|jgi:hypothetical protein